MLLNFDEYLNEEYQYSTEDALYEAVLGIKNPIKIGLIPFGPIINMYRTRAKVKKMLMAAKTPAEKDKLEKQLAKISSHEIDLMDEINNKTTQLRATQKINAMSPEEKAKLKAKGERIEKEIKKAKAELDEVSVKYEAAKGKMASTYHDPADWTKKQNIITLSANSPSFKSEYQWKNRKKVMGKAIKQFKNTPDMDE